MAGLSAAAVLCIENDNQEQKEKKNFYNTLRTVGKTCGDFKTEVDCYHKGSSECAYFKDNCMAIGTVPLVAYGHWIYILPSLAPRQVLREQLLLHDAIRHA